MKTRTGYLRLEKPPELTITAPECDACEVETIYDDGGLTCPSCGTYWDDAEEGVSGDLSEEAVGPACPNEFAWRVSNLKGKEREDAVYVILEALERADETLKREFEKSDG